MRLIPTRQIWRRWSLPSKLTAIGTYVTVVVILVGVGNALLQYFFRSQTEIARLEVELICAYSTYRVNIKNISNILALNPNVFIVSWANGAPDASIWIDKEIRNLMPKSNFIFDVNIQETGGFEIYPPDFEPLRSSSSGYIVATCDNCDKPRAWAFYIPGERQQYIDMYSEDGSWKIVEFDYPMDRPRIGKIVNYPITFDSFYIGWYPNAYRARNKNQ